MPRGKECDSRREVQERIYIVGIGVVETFGVSVFIDIVGSSFLISLYL
jgi:hypothetical protein